MTKIYKTILAGIALLACAGGQSLHADLRREIMDAADATSVEEARPLIEELKKSGKPEGWYLAGRLSMLDFNFPQAQKEFAEYRRLAKAHKFTGFDDAVAEALEGVKEGNLQFDRFRDLVVIDAIKVKRDKFFRQLRLPLSAGRIVDITEIPGDISDRGRTGFISEGGDFMMWNQSIAENDTADNVPVLVEANVLTDGSLSAPHPVTNLGDDPDYPFLTADGTTLYYSAYRDNSVGERDIFIATRDPQTGTYLQPVNAGFPFNSAADDYLLAIDEENGVGWWATDRHLLDDEVVLYVFLLPEGRKNFSGTDEEKRQRGRLDNIRVTWTSTPTLDSSDKEDDEDEEQVEKTPEEEAAELAEMAKNYEAKAAEVRKIKPGQKPKKIECMIPIGPGKYITSPEDVQAAALRNMMEEYIQAEKSQKELLKRLDTARRKYSNQATQQLGREILDMEKSAESGRIRLTSILSALYKGLGINR